MANSYYTGSLITIANYTGTIAAPIQGFRDANGNLADPTTVILKYRPGSAAATITITYPDARIVKDAVGLYHANIDSTGLTTQQIDEWQYEWIGQGSIIAALLNTLEVKIGL
jgi:hypothetical protein